MYVPHPLVRLDTSASRGASSSGTSFVCLSKCFRMIVIHVCSGWNFGLSLRETHARYRRVQCRTPAIAH